MNSIYLKDNWNVFPRNQATIPGKPETEETQTAAQTSQNGYEFVDGRYLLFIYTESALSLSIYILLCYITWYLHILVNQPAKAQETSFYENPIGSKSPYEYEN